jgi:phosphonatase-like hydrolase
MADIKMVMLDFSGTTIDDKTAVRDCLYDAAVEFGLRTDPHEVLMHIGTNKIHLYQFLIARQRGDDVAIEQFETRKDEGTRPQALRVFERYTELMIGYYARGVPVVPGAVETFRWLHEHGIKVAIDTGFHRDVANAIVEGTGWVRDGLVDIVVDVEHAPHQRGRPAPFMLFHAMRELDVQSVHQVVKVGDTPADMLEGVNAGCAGVVAVLSGPLPFAEWGCHRHTHAIPSIKQLPALLQREFGVR